MSDWKPRLTEKPRLTAKVLRGLNAVRAAVEAGDMLEGDLADDAESVNAAFNWIERMLEYRRGDNERS